MIDFKNNEFWFVVGSQYLYGEATLRQVANDAEKIAAGLGASEFLPADCKIVCKQVVKTAEEITRIVKEANYNDDCAGIIVWMHTFSPSKMWINGLSLLQKPYLHLHTQFGRNIPDLEIDMDFMNLHQSAHGDREHGFIDARMRSARKIVVGYWQDEPVRQKIGSWMRSAIGFRVSKRLKVVRFGDNMREVAVTEGDKVEAQLKFGWQVNTWPVGSLAEEISKVAEPEVDDLFKDYENSYEVNTDDIESVRYQAKMEIAIKRILEREGASAFCNTFQDLYGMDQLPGLASQHLMSLGYGFGAEGDWKISALTHIVKQMTKDRSDASFMEDYTYDLEPWKELCLGAHMLEVCPSIASGKAKIEVHPLGIGDRNPPARLVFEGKAGKAVLITLIDIGGRFRLIVHDVEAVTPTLKMPSLPVARVMWRPEPDLLVGTHCWILAGGAHHSVLSYSATAEMMEDWAEMMGIEFVHITKDTTVENLKQQLFFSDLAWKLK